MAEAITVNIPVEKPAETPAAPVTPAVETPATPAVTPPVADAKPAFDISVYEKEFTEKGALSDDSYKALADKHGVAKETVDEFIALRQAKQKANLDDVLSVVGGQETFAKISEWAGQALSDAELEAYNAQANASPAAAKLALQGLKARYDQQFGNPPSLVGGKATASGPAPFRSVAEVTAAMRDPKYKTDRAYQKDVEQRLAASNVF